MIAPATEISTLRKGARLDEALKKAREALTATPKDVYVKRAFGWVIHDLVKREAQELERGDAPAGRVANRFSIWLGEYRRVAPDERPGILHSLLLNQVLKGSQAWPEFLEFARWWDPQCMRAEDTVPYSGGDGKTVPSLQSRYAYAIGRAVAEPPAGVDGDLIGWGESFLDDALHASPDDPWLHYYKSKLLIRKGQPHDARKYLLRVVKRLPRSGWAWSLLGRTYENHDAEKAITCYFRAVQLAAQPTEALNTRSRLAILLAQARRFPEAARQVLESLEVRRKCNYRVPHELAQLARSDWYRDLVGAHDLPPEPDVADSADALLFACETSQLEFRLAVVDHQNQAKALAYVVFAPGEGAPLPYRKFRGVADLPVGAFVEVGFEPGSNKPSRWRRSSAERIDGLCAEHVGELTPGTGQPFGFIVSDTGERVFVPPALMSSVAASIGITVRCLAVLGKDKKHGKLGWRAIRIEVEPG